MCVYGCNGLSELYAKYFFIFLPKIGHLWRGEKGDTFQQVVQHKDPDGSTYWHQVMMTRLADVLKKKCGWSNPNVFLSIRLARELGLNGLLSGPESTFQFFAAMHVCGKELMVFQLQLILLRMRVPGAVNFTASAEATLQSAATRNLPRPQQLSSKLMASKC